MSDELSYIVFTDFDGTITRNDIGDSMFKVFGNPEECSKAFRAVRDGKIGMPEGWRISCATVESLSPAAFDSFVEWQEIDPGFHRFERYCAGKSIPVHILSDGFDLYIRHVLDREQLSHLPFYSNELIIDAGGTLTPRFPYTDDECRMCANCKRNLLLTKSGDESVIVYIGNGSSDQCPSKYADIVFAKGSLLTFCERENITYHRFESFDEVLSKFKAMVEMGRPRKRRTAELARKDIFMRG
jgi:2,3-diketo-5-methylthio-1-phosphopentane phosphatase